VLRSICTIVNSKTDNQIEIFCGKQVGTIALSTLQNLLNSNRWIIRHMLPWRSGRDSGFQSWPSSDSGLLGDQSHYQGSRYIIHKVLLSERV